MNINIEKLDALHRLQEQQNGALQKQIGHGESFEALLTRQMGVSDDAMSSSAELTPGTAQAGLISQILLQDIDQKQELATDTAVLQAAFTQASGTLDMWDGYARALSSSGEGASLKEAWNMLESIEKQVAQLRRDTDSIRGKSVGFDSLLNDLEVMTVTEKFKFNRGDYI